MTGARLSFVVFDLDGTIVDSRRDLSDAVNAMLVSFRITPLDDARVTKMIGDGAATLVARAFEAAGVPQPSNALARFLACYDTRLLATSHAYPGVKKALRVLARDRRLAVLTNKPLGPTRRILDGLDLAKFFEPRAVVGGDGPYGRKPDPAGLRSLIEMAGVDAASTVLVGDSPVDRMTARAAGVRVCVARYGFGFEGREDARLDADLAVDHPSQLPAVL